MSAISSFLAPRNPPDAVPMKYVNTSGITKSQTSVSFSRSMCSAS
jgi:hypothetical protein